MLAELSIDDLVLIAGARLELAAGLNVITGETGAGKTLLTQGIGLLLGQKGEESLVRPGAEQALVQAVFDDDGETLSVARRITRGGRSRAFLDGLVSSLPAVEAVLRERVAFYGQLEHARLLQLDRQLDLLDAWAGAGVAALLDDYATAWSTAQELSRELLTLRSAGRDRERELDLLRFQIDEIEAAAIEPGEDELLKAERERLRHGEKLVERVGGAIALFSDESSGGGLDALRTAARLLAEAEALDRALAAAAARLAGLTAEADDLLSVLRAYLDDLDVDPAHRDAVELRYDRLSLLARKYGGSADAVIAHAVAASERLVVLERLAADESDLVARLDHAQARAVALAARLSQARAAAAPAFAAGVADELRGLAMPHVRFEVVLQPRGEGPDALGPRGADEAEFVFSANPGVPPRPLRETASGGELSRAMLAIKSLVHLGHDVRTLIFDEVDTGIGGVTATVLGERLAALARGRGGGAAPRRRPDRLYHAPAPGSRFRRAPFRDHQAGRRPGRRHRDGRHRGRRRRSPRRAGAHARRRARRPHRPRARPRATRAGALRAHAVGGRRPRRARRRRCVGARACRGVSVCRRPSAAPESLSALRPLVYLLPEVTSGLAGQTLVTARMHRAEPTTRRFDSPAARTACACVTATPRRRTPRERPGAGGDCVWRWRGLALVRPPSGTIGAPRHDPATTTWPLATSEGAWQNISS
jgi:DNA repair protein RecN (Recombination protein N)